MKHKHHLSQGKKEEQNFFFKTLYNIKTNLLFLIVIVYIIFIYYIYLFWNIVPLFYFSKNGLDYKFWKLENFEDKNYISALIHFTIFHYLLFWMTFSLIKTSNSNPGELSSEYTATHSLINREEFKNIDNIDSPPLIDNLNLTKSELKNQTPITSSNTDLLNIKEDEFLSYDSYDEMEEMLNEKNSGHRFRLESNLNVQPLTKQAIDDGYEIIKEECLNKKFRRCRYCLLIKPERTHHCRRCRKCVRVSDHHCFFLNNCIGVSNFKYFINFLIYSLVLLIYTNFSMLSGLGFCYFNDGGDSVKFVAFSSAMIFNMIAFGFTSYILYIQIWLVSKDITMHEYIALKRRMKHKYSKSTSGLKVEAKMNLIEEIKKRFGRNILNWIFPFDKDRSHQGY